MGNKHKCNNAMDRLLPISRAATAIELNGNHIYDCVGVEQLLTVHFS